MLFNSLEFFFFFIAVFALYCLLRHRAQNILLLAAGYVFYAAWDWRFLFLLVFTTCVDYACALLLAANSGRTLRRFWLTVSIASNLAVLGFFKYFDFFAAQLSALLGALGLPFHTGTLAIILPVGLSFYTFQSLSYVIDVYRKDAMAVRSFPDFALYVSFFPQLVAGPISRAQDLIPQIQSPRQVRWANLRAGLYLFVWGLFKKCVIADNLAPIANAAFASPGSGGLGELALGTLAFAFQIYGDFSGYSDMAIGLALCLGFRLPQNFAHPYFAPGIQEFWHRWHITLSRWMRDYLYIPLGGNRHGAWQTYRNILVTMALGGLWHGASWHFVVWGVYHGALLVLDRMLKPLLSGIPRIAGIVLTFGAVCAGWILFRVSSMGELAGLLRGAWQNGLGFSELLQVSYTQALLLCSLLLGLEWLPYRRENALAYLGTPTFLRWLHYAMLIFLLVLFGAPLGASFLYFQF